MKIDCVLVKDRILGQLNEVWDNPMEFCKLSEKIIDTLKMTDGLWNELRYSYKALDICNTIIARVRVLSQDMNHAATLSRLNFVYSEACATGDHFHRLQSDQLCDDMGVTDQRTREITRMTNLELAS